LKGKNHKKPKFGITPEGKKEAVSAPADSFLDRKASWRLNRLQLVDPYGWHELDDAGVRYVQSKLAEFERRTWSEIFVKDKHWNHPVPVTGLKCSQAREWMRRNMPDQTQLWTLRLSGAERIWGVFAEGTYLVIFWDPNHIIWDTPKR